jgi:hypothetical protein
MVERLSVSTLVQISLEQTQILDTEQSISARKNKSFHFHHHQLVQLQESKIEKLR